MRWPQMRYRVVIQLVVDARAEDEIGDAIDLFLTPVRLLSDSDW